MQTTWRVIGAHYSVSITKTYADSNGKPYGTREMLLITCILGKEFIISILNHNSTKDMK